MEKREVPLSNRRQRLAYAHQTRHLIKSIPKIIKVPPLYSFLMSQSSQYLLIINIFLSAAAHKVDDLDLTLLCNGT